MHTYSIDTKERNYVLLVLAIVSILSTWSFNKLSLYYQIVFPWWLESPSVLLFYGILFSVFDKYCWKWRMLSRIIKTPNFNGEWVGFIESSFDKSLKTKATLKIYQNWTRIKILLSTDQSSSRSESASIILESPDGASVYYLYVNEPKTNSIETMHMHRGTARLTLYKNMQALDGDYYTGRDRQNFGSFKFKRVV